MAATFAFQAFLVAIPWAIWRLAKKSGHGRTWDILFAFHALTAFCLIPSVDRYDPIGSFCDPDYGTIITAYGCTKAQVISALGMVYVLLGPVLLGVLAIKAWPRMPKA